MVTSLLFLVKTKKQMSLVSNNDETILKGKSGATDEAETPKLFQIRPKDCI